MKEQKLKIPLCHPLLQTIFEQLTSKLDLEVKLAQPKFKLDSKMVKRHKKLNFHYLPNVLNSLSNPISKLAVKMKNQLAPRACRRVYQIIKAPASLQLTSAQLTKYVTEKCKSEVPSKATPHLL